ncbi:MAG: GNAT family N-acetyltransferase, partial [Planctomycetota bacterium]
AYRRKGVGSALLARAEKKLTGLGCVKINLQIMEGNEMVEQFYLSKGYSTEKRISMGKRLNENVAGAKQQNSAGGKTADYL